MLAARDFIVYLGRHDLRDRKEEGSQEMDVCLFLQLHNLLPIHYYFLCYGLFNYSKLLYLSVIFKYTSKIPYSNTLRTSEIPNHGQFQPYKYLEVYPLFKIFFMILYKQTSTIYINIKIEVHN
jgi:hypothetical protein